MHPHDKALLSKLLTDEKLSYQSFAHACMDAFLRGDPSIMKVIKDFKTLRDIPKEHMDKFSLSKRERDAMLDELEKDRTGQAEHA